MANQRIEEQVGDFFSDEAPEGWEAPDLGDEDSDITRPPEDLGDSGEELEDDSGDQGTPSDDDNDDDDSAGSADDNPPADNASEEGSSEGSGEGEGEPSADDSTPAASSGDDQPSGGDSIEELRAQNQLLMEKINALMGNKGDTPAPAQQPPAPQQQQQQQETGQVQEYNLFEEGEDLDEILSTKDGANKLFSKMINMAVNVSQENLLRAMPGVVKQQVKVQNELLTTINAFYDENKDLQPVRKVMGVVVNEVAAEHQDWTLTAILDETATRVRKMLGLKGQALSKDQATPPAENPSNPKPSGNNKKPALPGAQKTGGSRGKGGDVISDQQKQINELI